MNGKRVGLYLRVSTGEQTVDNQREALTAACLARGWRVVEKFCDDGISGAKGWDKRPGFDRLLKATTRRKIDIVAAWSVDRLGRSLQDLVGFLGELNAVGCDLYLERQAVDTTTPAGRALFQMLGVFAEFERAIIQERIHAGIARARAKGTKSGKPIGRPKIAPRKVERIRELLGDGTGIIKTARLCGTGVGVLQRIKQEMAAIPSAPGAPLVESRYNAPVRSRNADDAAHLCPSARLRASPKSQHGLSSEAEDGFRIRHRSTRAWSISPRCSNLKIPLSNSGTELSSAALTSASLLRAVKLTAKYVDARANQPSQRRG